MVGRCTVSSDVDEGPNVPVLSPSIDGRPMAPPACVPTLFSASPLARGKSLTGVAARSTWTLEAWLLALTIWFSRSAICVCDMPESVIAWR